MSLFCRVRLSQFYSSSPFRIPSPRTASRSSFQAFFTHTPPPRFSFKRQAIWLVPLAGGLGLYLAPRPKSLLPEIISSPDVIPCHPRVDSSTILSPSESDLTLSSRIISLLRDNIWEPILTATRFVYLLVLFMPVIVCSPMLLVGVPEKRYKGDRWGAIWWYGLLVSRMQAAGPTFIKVRAANIRITS